MRNRSSRREFLSLLAAGAASPLLAADAKAPLFVEVPPSVSGITWNFGFAL
jgi:hypothetical protein